MTSSEICFGLDQETDRRSLIIFLAKFSDPALLAALVPRLSAEELLAVLDLLTSLMHKHFTDNEYHRLFLDDSAATSQTDKD